jgi:uncharacterized RDD family membrane protein YckC
MPREYGSWLSGPPPYEPGTPAQGPADYPGQRLGLPDKGPGAQAASGRRLFALIVDWFIAVGLTGLAPAFAFAPADFLHTSVGQTVVAAVWLVLGAVSVRLFSFTPGQYAVGLKVASIDDREHVGIGRALVRGLLIAAVVPVLFSDTDGRGLQDKLTATAVVRR